MILLKPTYTIDELLTRCRAGERVAQELLYKQFASKMLGVCFRYATDRMEAEDMLQNGFIKVFQKIADYRGEGSFEGWVRRIMVHSSIEYYRKYHKMVQLVDIEHAESHTSVDALVTSKLAAYDLM